MQDNFQVGQRLRWHGHPYEVMDVHRSDVVLIGTRLGRTIRATMDELQEARKSGDLNLESAPATQAALMAALQAGKPEGKSTIEFRLIFVTAVLDQTIRFGDLKIIGKIVKQTSKQQGIANIPGSGFSFISLANP